MAYWPASAGNVLTKFNVLPAHLTSASDVPNRIHKADRLVDLTPSMHWPAPLTAQDIEQDRGPVLVTVEYRISPQDREAFLLALEKVGSERRRDGAYRWGVYEDTAEQGRFVETFVVASWIEHLRQHERVTNADRLQEEVVLRFHLAGEPKVTHFIAAEP
jgi:quinol monooxygenase YgiN